MPILIADMKTRNIAALHSGLKGLKKKIISKTLKRLEEIGSKKNNLIISIGPSITGDQYQVKRKDIKDLISQIPRVIYTENSLYNIIINNGTMTEELIPVIKKGVDPERLFLTFKQLLSCNY